MCCKFLGICQVRVSGRRAQCVHHSFLALPWHRRTVPPLFASILFLFSFTIGFLLLLCFHSSTWMRCNTRSLYASASQQQIMIKMGGFTRQARSLDVRLSAIAKHCLQTSLQIQDVPAHQEISGIQQKRCVTCEQQKIEIGDYREMLRLASCFH